MRIGKVSYNGTSSDSFGMIVAGAGTYDAAELDTTSYTIPGRSGDLILSNKRYKNILVTYPAFIPKGFEASVQAVRDWMRSAKTYARIEDNFDTAHFRLGIGKGILTFSPVAQNDAANYQLIFDCKPQRFLLTGETQVTKTSGSTINNGTQYVALPLIEITNPTASAKITFTHASGTYVLDSNSAYTGTVMIDCETQNIYAGSNNHNSKWSGPFPVLNPGTTTITFSGLGSFKITPRWWEL